MEPRTCWKKLMIEGQRFELWEDPERSFGYTARHLESFVAEGRWELVFNALAIAASQAASETPALMCSPRPQAIAVQ